MHRYMHARLKMTTFTVFDIQNIISAFAATTPMVEADIIHRLTSESGFHREILTSGIEIATSINMTTESSGFACTFKG